jgi:class 3 adenylate cyclase
MKRKIMAILAADIAGYTRLTCLDEEETLGRLAAYRAVFDDFVKQFGGRTFNRAGDAIFSEFSSAVDAARCAVEIQESIRSRNLAYPQNRQLYFRIGINIGDVVERDGDLLGDGVNIAKRLEGLAEPGAICVSEAVFDQIANKMSIHIRDLGRQTVKNINRPIHAYLLDPRHTSGTSLLQSLQKYSLRPLTPGSHVAIFAAVLLAAAAGYLWSSARLWPRPNAVTLNETAIRPQQHILDSVKDQPTGTIDVAGGGTATPHAPTPRPDENAEKWLSIGIELPKTTYRAGEDFSFALRASNSCKFLVYTVDDGGRIEVHDPRTSPAFMGDPTLKARERRPIPVGAQAGRVRVNDRPGHYQLNALCADDELASVADVEDVARQGNQAFQRYLGEITTRIGRDHLGTASVDYEVR